MVTVTSADINNLAKVKFAILNGGFIVEAAGIFCFV